jgi:hypothetical protein
LLKNFTRLLLLLLLCYLLPGNAGAQQPNAAPNLNLGDAVVTGFSGTIALDPTKPRPANKSAIDLTFINPDGSSARIVGIGRPGYVWDGRLFQAPKTFDVFAKDTGQVFGVALDDQPAPNIYLAATSAFGLNLIDRGAGGQSERRKVGGTSAGWMKGQFGLDLQGDPGSIYKVDGTTGAVTLFAKVMLDGVPNPGPALGNLAYDAAHKQLFASDLYTGMIHRLAIADGSEPGAPYDHGVTGRGAANLPPMPFNPANRPNIANNKFNSENPDSWGFAPPERRVWGLAVQAGRLFYSARNGSTTEGPQIWSVGIAQDGSFGTDARLEVEVAAQPGPYPVSDIAFSQKGAMILAQRAPVAASYDYSAFTRPGEPRVLRYWLKDANDPPSPGLWKPVPEEYAVGFAGTYRNTDGGVALGYGYGPDGILSGTTCEAALWTTGQNLRNNPALRGQLDPGGPLVVNGLQGSPADMVRSANAPPAISYFIDYDGKYDDASASGHMGSVRILARPCVTAVAGGSSPPNFSGPQTGGGGGGGPPPPPNACIVPTSLATSFSLPPCTRPGQPVSLDLSTASSAGVDPNWTVSPPGPNPFHTSYWNWTVNSANWVQPAQSATVVDLPIGKYVYTRAFNLACRPESYRSLQLSGNFGSDNDATMTLNGPGNVVASCTNCYNTVPVTFTHAGPAFFVPGLNLLTVTVTNRPPGGPTGLSLIGKLEAICGPDCICGCPPGTVLVDGQCVPPPKLCPPPQVPNADGICMCPTPMVPGAIPGTCICPPGTQDVGGKCVRPPPVCPPPQIPNADGICMCPAPMVPGAIPGTCICPPGTQDVGGKCVRPPPVCPPPQIPNADGICMCPTPMVPGAIPGSCICPTGTEQAGGKCVTPVIRCPSPLILNADGKCVKPEVKPKREKPKRKQRQEQDEPQQQRRVIEPDREFGIPGIGGRSGGGGFGGGSLGGGQGGGGSPRR